MKDPYNTLMTKILVGEGKEGGKLSFILAQSE